MILNKKLKPKNIIFVMMIFLMFIFFVGGGWLIGKFLVSIAFKETNPIDHEPNITINNYTTETHNHLHISDKEFEKLKSR